MPRHAIASVLALMALTVSGSEAQWLNHPTPGIPRTPDGKPDLNAPAPKFPDGTPDLSGYWNQPLAAAYASDITSDLRPEDVKPAAVNFFDQRVSQFGKDNPALIGCLPMGPGISSVVSPPAEFASCRHR